MLKKETIYISGMHCQACKKLIEAELGAMPGIKTVLVDLAQTSAGITYDEDKISLKNISDRLNRLNYRLTEKQAPKARPSYFFLAITVFLLLSLFFAVKRFGGMDMLEKLNDTTIGLGLIFLIGLFASLHCVGMCGGLIVSYSALQKSAKIRPHILYNSGRLISYATIGGLLGGLGSFFAINPNFSGFLLLVAGALMLLMGLSLLTDHKFFKKIKVNTPPQIAGFLYKNKLSKNPKGPFVIGLLTGFMPCGPLQAMQLYAVSTGSPGTGALAMLVYGLGTAPTLLGFGYAISLLKKINFAQIMKASGVIVLLLGISTLNRGLSNFGLGVKAMFAEQSPISENSAEIQAVNMRVSYTGYEPNVIYLKKGIPVRWTIDGSGITGCTDEILVPDYNIKQPLTRGETVIEFTPTNPGEVKFHCWMKMVWGKFIVE